MTVVPPERMCPGSGDYAADLSDRDGACPVCLTRHPLIPLTGRIAPHVPNTPTV